MSGKQQRRQSPRNHIERPQSAALLEAKKHMKKRCHNMKNEGLAKDDYEIARNSRMLVKKKSGVVFDDCMVEHYCLWDSSYPECPARYTSIMERCKELGLLDHCVVLPSRFGTTEEIFRKHDPSTLDTLRNTANESDVDKLEELSSKYDAIFINNASLKTALLSVGSTIDLVTAVINGYIQNGMAIIRPPGHHAMANEYCGYCFFNNAALAAANALAMGVERILIVDWDVHHGQGTQQMFYDDPRVLYFSIHRYEQGLFWPNLRESDFHYIGGGDGKGYNFNVPLNAVGMTDADYLAVFQQILMPVAYEFEPELVIVSAGYDAAIGCPEGEMEITPACYAHMTSSLMGLAEGKVAVILEGGYCLKSLAEGAALTLRALQGAPTPSLFDFGVPCATMVKTILDVIYTHRPYWESLRLQEQGVVSLNPELHVPHVTFLGNETKPEKYATRDCYPVQSAEFLQKVDSRLNKLQVMTKLTDGPRVGIVADMAMTAHFNSDESDHPEKPERVRAIIERHQEFNVLSRCISIQPRVATDEELRLVHNEEHLNEMKSTPQKSQVELTEMADTYESVYLNPKSYECALLAAGSVLSMVDSVVNGDVTSGVAIVRPPGHHAEEDAPCGFCLFNNVALAARYAVDIHGLKRVVIIDWDVHHGNGIQRIFESDPRVLYISLHRYNHGRFFPSSDDADYDRVGVGAGKGFNINIPWNKSGGGMTDGDYIAAFHAVILPVLYQFNPELILVSAGFDACINDPLGHCKVTPEAYAHMTHWLLPLAGGRIILALEGGYHITSISYAMTLCTKALLGDPLPVLKSTTIPSPSAIETIRSVIGAQRPFWSCLAFSKLLPEVDVLQPKRLSKPEKEVLNDLLSLEVNIRQMALDERGDKKDTQNIEPSPGPSNSVQPGGNKQTLEAYLRENLEMLTNEDMYAVVPLASCPHLDQVAPVPADGINCGAACQSCESGQENWICLTCYLVQCGRYVSGHMVEHTDEETHPLALSFSDLSVWCYACEAYIDNMVLYEAKNAAHQNKFGQDLVWSYGPRLEKE